MGCVLSHLEILLQAQSDGLDYVVIFEDDVTFYSDFNNQLQTCLDELPLDWAGLWIGGTKAQHAKYQKHSDNVFRNTGSWGTFGYAINAPYYQICIDQLSKLDATADALYMRLMGHYPFYICKNKLISHSSGYSYIAQKDRDLKWLK